MRKYIGIDSGVNTGVAIWSGTERSFESISTHSILEAMEIVLKHRDEIKTVIVEDARQVQFKTSRAKAQGAGSVKRDCQIWEEFLKRNNIHAMFVRPRKQITKMDASRFNVLTKWNKPTNQHGRDAAMLVFGLK